MQPGMAQGGMSSAGMGPPGMVQDGYHAMATANMATRQPAGPPTQRTAMPAGQTPSPSYQPASWPPPTSQTPWPQPPAPDAMAQYTPAPPTPRPPTSVLAAVWLMYAGAAFSLLGMLVSLATIGRLKATLVSMHMLSANVAKSLAGVASVEVLVGSGAVVALWLWLANASRQGHGWARTVGTVLFGLHTASMLLLLGKPGIAEVRGIGFVIWLIGLFTVMQLWRRQSSAFFFIRR